MAKPPGFSPWELITRPIAPLGFFAQAVSDLKLNVDISDRRLRVVVHTLRRTFACRHVPIGAPLHTVSKLMGRSSLKMTERYAHFAPDAKRAAAMGLEGI